MSVLVSDLLQSVRKTLNDPTPGQTWSDTDLVGFGNRVIAAACNIKRDLAPQIVMIPLQPGSIQNLPSNGLALMEVYYNVVSGAACRQGGLELKSAKFPSWRAAAPTNDAVTWFTDERSPLVFHVDPPNTGNGQVAALIGTVPSMITVSPPRQRLTRSATPSTEGRPRERAMMAVWLSAPPMTAARPQTVLGSSRAVSAGVISSATITALRGRAVKGR